MIFCFLSSKANTKSVSSSNLVVKCYCSFFNSCNHTSFASYEYFFVLVFMLFLRKGNLPLKTFIQLNIFVMCIWALLKAHIFSILSNIKRWKNLCKIFLFNMVQIQSEDERGKEQALDFSLHRDFIIQHYYNFFLQYDFLFLRTLTLLINDCFTINFLSEYLFSFFVSLQCFTENFYSTEYFCLEDSLIFIP